MSAPTIPPSFPDDAERRASLALTLVADVGSVTHKQLIERFGTASRALACAVPAPQAQKAYAAADAQLAAARTAGIALTGVGDAAYPESLRDLRDPPATLWSIGDWNTLSNPVVAIVGTRRATEYGRRVTRELAASLARAGTCVVSGMALGIDAEAHRAVLGAEGKTVAVLGTGADVPYPRAHVALHREIMQHGLILSELAPSARSDAGSFPRRNRIIAALARLTIVVEAPVKSGALITAGIALELGRDVAAVPGPIDSPQSVGTNTLIRDGAQIITCLDDVLALLGLQPPVRRQVDFHSHAEERIWEALQQGAGTLDDLCMRARLPVAECLAAVTGLEIRGVVECALTGEVRRR